MSFVDDLNKRVDRDELIEEEEKQIKRDVQGIIDLIKRVCMQRGHYGEIYLKNVDIPVFFSPIVLKPCSDFSRGLHSFLCRFCTAESTMNAVFIPAVDCPYRAVK